MAQLLPGLEHLHDLRHERKDQAELQIKRIRTDTVVGMAFSELIAFFVILTAAVTLHSQGVTEIGSALRQTPAAPPARARRSSRTLSAIE